jgi:hypothetical protein
LRLPMEPGGVDVVAGEVADTSAVAPSGTAKA